MALLSLVVTPLRAADVTTFTLVDKGLNPSTTISYFDHEHNSAYKGDAWSSVHSSREGLHFRFDISDASGAYAGWYIAARNQTGPIADKNVLRFELKGSAQIPTDHFQIGIRSENVPAEDNNAKITLEELGYRTFPQDYVEIAIPLSVFMKREPALDPARVSHLLIVSIVEPDHDIHKADVFIRNARWSWELQRTVGGDFVAVLPDSLFDDNGGVKGDLRPYLEKVKEAAETGAAEIRVEGHATTFGDFYNQRMSRWRAQAVAKALVTLGVSGRKITTVGLGSQRPVVADAKSTVNNRVEITIRPASM
jgi:hypothetical protein